MIDLTDLNEIKKLDPKDVYGSTAMFADQCQQIWNDSKKVDFPDNYKDIKNIVICGMGGSAYGGHIAQTLFKEELNIPLFVNSNYHLPGFVNEKTLVILTSYSGTTEEVLSCAEVSLQKKAKITGLTSGGKLGEFLTKNSFPSLIFNPIHNPSGQPRLGTGYIVLGTIAILYKVQALDTDIDEAIQSAVFGELKQESDMIKKKAIEVAKKIKGFIPIIFSAEFLGGNAHIMRNQFNETSKTFSAFSELPELNHHLMEGFKNPRDKKLIVLFLYSDSYSDILKKRITLTKNVLDKNNIQYIPFQSNTSSRVAQMLSVLSFGGWATFFLALLYGQDPSVIPWVDYFKEKLKSS